MATQEQEQKQATFDEKMTSEAIEDPEKSVVTVEPTAVDDGRCHG